jgi:glutamate dehydrogenase
LRHQPSDFNVSHVIERYKTDTRVLGKVISGAIIGQSRKNYLAAKRRFIKARLPAGLAQELVDKTALASAFDIIEIKLRLFSETENVAKLFYLLSERLQLHWIRDAISQTIVRTHWTHLAILNLRNDLHANQHNLTELVMQAVDNKKHTNKAMTIWEGQNTNALKRYDSILTEFSAMRTCDFPTISVAVSEVRRLVQLGKREHYKHNDKIDI